MATSLGMDRYQIIKISSKTVKNQQCLATIGTYNTKLKEPTSDSSHRTIGYIYISGIKMFDTGRGGGAVTA